MTLFTIKVVVPPEHSFSDGNIISVSAKCFRCPASLFQSSFLFKDTSGIHNVAILQGHVRRRRACRGHDVPYRASAEDPDRAEAPFHHLHLLTLVLYGTPCSSAGRVSRDCVLHGDTKNQINTDSQR